MRIRAKLLITAMFEYGEEVEIIHFVEKQSGEICAVFISEGKHLRCSNIFNFENVHIVSEG